MSLLIVNTIATAVILIHGLFFAINRMDRCTAHRVRIAWLVTTTGAFGVLIGSIFNHRLPTIWEVILTVGFALYLKFDRRHGDRCERPT
jgi:hypothetical protein